MKEKTDNNNEQKKSNSLKKHLTRGIIAIIASVLIVLLIKNGIGKPYPNLKFAYIASAATAVWGLFELIRGLFESKNSK